jgi:8-oxo-dGTP pyrophosphatase MutT (NUDIX family)
MRQPVQVLVHPVRRTGATWEYLLLRRIEERGGFWQGVTGGVEEGEDLAEAATRELLEETGLEPLALEDIGYSYSYSIAGDEWQEHFPDAGVVRITEHVFVAIVEERQDPVIDPHEHDGWKWLRFREALKLLKWQENVNALKLCDRLVRARLR